MAVLHPRPRAVARVPLGRGRARRLLRPQAATVFRAGALEREGPDSEGAAVRPEQRRGEPRRGRQGVLLLSRFHADPLVHEVALQVPAGGVSLRRPGEDECAPHAARTSSTSSSTPACSTTTATSTSSSNMPSRLRRNASSGSPSRTAARRPRRFICLPTLWFRNTWNWWPERGEAAPGGGERHAAARASWRRRTRSSAIAGSTAMARRRCCSPRTTPTPSGSSTRPTRAPTSRTPSTRSSCTGRPTPSTRRRPAPRPPPTTASRSAPGQSVTVRLCLTDAPPAIGSVRGLREDARGQAPRGGRVLPPAHAGVGQRGRRAASCARPSAASSGRSSTTSSTSTCGSASTACDPFDAPALGPDQEPPVVPHVQRRRHLDAGQVGVPVVRRLGSRLSRRRADAASTRTSPSISST